MIPAMEPVRPHEVIAALHGRSQSVATAESLTGGLLVATLIDPPGASDVVRGGVVAYVAETKIGVLGVPAGLIEEHGTVSQECAEAMAQGARRALGADWALATTGVAGPAPSEGKAVGTVHVAVAGEQGTSHRALSLDGSRERIRLNTVRAALQLLLEALEGPAGQR